MKATDNIIHIDGHQPSVDQIRLAVAVLRRGGVVVFPTSGLYGLGSDAFNAHAIERIFQIKGRDAGKPILVLIDTMEMVEQVAINVSPMGRFLMQQLWPGRVTFVVPAASRLPSELTGDSGKIGIRQAAHPVAAALVKVLGRPLTGTSANISGEEGCAAIEQIDSSIQRNVDLVLDAGSLRGGPGSTVVDVIGAIPRILRPGAVPAKEIMDLFDQFVVNNVDNGN